MIKVLPYLSSNLRAVSSNNDTFSYICKVIIDNYKGNDYKELDYITSHKFNKTLILSNSSNWQLHYCLLDKFEYKYFYNNAIIKPLDNDILKFTVGKQAPSILNYNSSYLIKKPTIIHNNLNQIRTRCLIFKYL
tara:strand:- start:3115 stop:3516 length:402 start_codon:yes stop_codon:yes gene_type:complete